MKWNRNRENNTAQKLHFRKNTEKYEVRKIPVLQQEQNVEHYVVFYNIFTESDILSENAYTYGICFCYDIAHEDWLEYAA